MRVIQGDIGLSGELHKLYQEYAKDSGTRQVSPEMWLKRFLDPTFFCLIAKHGKKPVGLVMGRKCSYFIPGVVELETFFVRRGFRKFKFIRAFAQAVKDDLKASNYAIFKYNRNKSRERVISYE